MSAEQMQAFVAHVSSDEDLMASLQEKLGSMKGKKLYKALVALGEEHGFEFTVKEAAAFYKQYAAQARAQG